MRSSIFSARHQSAIFTSRDAAFKPRDYPSTSKFDHPEPRFLECFVRALKRHPFDVPVGEGDPGWASIRQPARSKVRASSEAVSSAWCLPTRSRGLVAERLHG
jgi:hypothetical protein